MEKLDHEKRLVDLSPFVSTSLASITPILPRPLFPQGDAHIGRLTLWTDSMIEIDLHRVGYQTGLGMFIPEHAKVSHADGRHQRANHLVELAGGGSQYSSESGISHIQKRLYPCFLAGSLVLLRIRLFRCQARTRPLTITYQRGESRLAKHTVPDSYRYGSRIRPEGRVAAGRWTKLSKRFEAVFLKLL